jgi:hypothetical protein
MPGRKVPRTISDPKCDTFVGGSKNFVPLSHDGWICWIKLDWVRLISFSGDTFLPTLEIVATIEKRVYFTPYQQTWHRAKI